MLNNKNVWILISGEFIAGLGMWLGVIGNLEFLQAIVPSDLNKSLILLAGMFAGLLVGPMAGRIIDVTSKKKVLLYSGAARIFSTGFMFLAIMQENIWWMVVYMIGIGLAAAFYFPALQACIPMIAKDGDLLTLNGIHMNAGTIARILGTVLAGILLVYISLFSLYSLAILSYIVIFICTLFLNFEEKITPQSNAAGKGSFKELLPLLKTLPQVVMGLFLFLIPTLFLGSFNLMVLKISELQNDPQIKSWLYTAEGIAFMLGAFLVKRFFDGKDPVKIMMTFSIVISFTHLSLYFADLQIPAIISFAVFGFSAGAFFPVAATMFQTTVPREFHGRFFSFRGMLDRISFQVVLVCSGFFLDTIGFKNMVLCFGIVSIVLVAYFAAKQYKGTSQKPKLLL